MTTPTTQPTLQLALQDDTHYFQADAQHIARRQYLQKGDQTISGMFARIALGVTQHYTDPAARQQAAQTYYDLMVEKKFCPGGRIIAGAGTTHGNVLNCFVQAATDHDPSTFQGVMEVARKLALVTKVGGGNGVNLDPYQPSVPTAINAAGVAALHHTHPDVLTFLRSEMTPSNNPDGPKEYVALRRFTRVLIHEDGETVSDAHRRAAQTNNVPVMSHTEFTSTHGSARHIDVPDDIGGIIDAASEMAAAALRGEQTLVIHLDKMRAEGSPIRGSGGTSSGPFSFLTEVFDNFLTWACLGGHQSGPINTLRYVYAPVLRVVRQGGTRRGAGMATISVWNAHVLDFLTAKDLDREAAEGDISTFNISILQDSAFRDAIEHDRVMTFTDLVMPEGKFDLSAIDAHDLEQQPDGTWRVRARWLDEQIAQHAWATGEPGVIFVDRVNHYSALKNLGERYQIRSTNPCLAPGTDVMYREIGSDHGPHTAPVETLLDRDVEVIDGVDGQWYPTRFKVTGRNETVWNLETDLGSTEYFTPYHTFFRADGTPAQLRELEVGEQLLGGNGTLHTVYAVGTDTRTEAEVYCCTVHPHHRFMLANGLLSGNCGEIPLTAGEPCDLGAINLAAYVKPGRAAAVTDSIPGLHDRHFDLTAFRQDVATYVTFLDDVLDVNVFALEDNRVASHDLRRLGLGVMGLADALVLLGYRYNDDEGRAVISRVMNELREAAVARSETLGQERGVYPVYDRHADQIPHAPRRNVAVLTVAPTGTTSMLMGVSSGIEPIFSPFVWRKIGSEYRAMLAPLFVDLMEHVTLSDEQISANLARTVRGTDTDQTGAPVTHTVMHHTTDGIRWNWDAIIAAVSDNHGSVVGLPFIPDEIQRVFLCAHDISPEDHVRMQAAVQVAFDGGEQYAGNALSKTVNLPNSATVDDIRRAYSEAYATGCKGITVYRDGSRQFQVLSTKKTNPRRTAAEAELTARGLSTDLLTDEYLTRDPDMDAATLATLIERDHYRAQVQRLQDQLNDALHQLSVQSATTTDPLNTPKLPRYTREPQLTGITTQVKLTDMNTSVRTSYLAVINVDEHDGMPIEAILVGGNSGQEAHADSEALGRVVSNALQYGVPAQVIIHSLQDINGGLMGSASFGSKTRLINSKAALIAAALDDALKRAKTRHVHPATDHAAPQPVTPAAPGALTATAPTAREVCVSCNEAAVIREEGCLKCQACGYSKCG